MACIDHSVNARLGLLGQEHFGQCLSFSLARKPQNCPGLGKPRLYHSSVGSVPVVSVTQALLRGITPKSNPRFPGESPKTAMHQENSQQSARLLFLSTQNDTFASSAVQT